VIPVLAPVTVATAIWSERLEVTVPVASVVGIATVSVGMVTAAAAAAAETWVAAPVTFSRVVVVAAVLADAAIAQEAQPPPAAHVP